MNADRMEEKASLNNFRPASPGRRFTAYLMDILPIVLVLFLIAWFLLGFDKVFATYAANRRNLNARLEFYFYRNLIRDLSFVLYLIYSCLFEASSFQATPGKTLQGLRVVDENQEPLTIRRAVLRNFCKLLCTLPCFLGFLPILWRPDRRGGHDLLAKTYVISTN